MCSCIDFQGGFTCCDPYKSSQQLHRKYQDGNPLTFHNKQDTLLVNSNLLNQPSRTSFSICSPLSLPDHVQPYVVLGTKNVTVMFAARRYSMRYKRAGPLLQLYKCESVGGILKKCVSVRTILL